MNSCPTVVHIYVRWKVSIGKELPKYIQFFTCKYNYTCQSCLVLMLLLQAARQSHPKAQLFKIFCQLHCGLIHPVLYHINCILLWSPPSLSFSLLTQLQRHLNVHDRERDCYFIMSNLKLGFLLGILYCWALLTFTLALPLGHMTNIYEF